MSDVIKLKQVPATPFYLYDQSRLESLCRSLKKELAPEQESIHVHYALKANSNPQLLEFFCQQGFGADIVSGGELRLAQKVGFKEIVFSGVGKSVEELELAVDSGVELINVESFDEARQLGDLASKKQKVIDLSLRLNPNVDPKTHPYIATGLSEHKFGLRPMEAHQVYRYLQEHPHLNPNALSMHIGSQLHDLSVLHEALGELLQFAKKQKEQGLELTTLDVGGGLGVDYLKPRENPPFKEYGKFLKEALRCWREVFGERARVLCELGRSLVAPAGFLFSRVLVIKNGESKNFAVIDAGMNDYMRPSLYQSEHLLHDYLGRNSECVYDVVGPICESADVMAKNCQLPALKHGDLLYVSGVGAYGYVMAHHYNQRSLPAEYLYADGNLHSIRDRIAPPGL